MKHLIVVSIFLLLLGVGGIMAEETTFSWEPLVIEKLANGITVIIKEDRTRPLAITDIWFKVGSRNETDENNGISHFLEHTLFKGTKNRGIGVIARDIEAMGARTNAATSLDFTHYYISCEADKIMQALEIHADIFRNSLLDPKAIDDERGVIIEEIKRGEDTPGSVLWNTLTENIFTSHPYRRPIIGPRENIASGGISRQDMYDFFTTWYNTGNMYLLVVGAVEPQAILAKVKELYGDLPLKNRPDVEFIVDPELKGPPRIVRKEMDINRSHVMMGYRTVPLKKAEESICLDVLGVILGFGRSSRLSMELKEKLGLVTSIAAGQTSLTDDGLFLVRAEFDPVDEDAVLDGIKEEIRQIVREPVSEEELQKAKDFLENAYLRAIETVEGKAESLGSTLMRTDLEYEKKYLERIRAVTGSQLQMLANKYLAGDNYVMVLIGPRPRVKASEVVEHPVSGKTGKYTFANGLKLIHREIPGSGLVGLTMAVDAGSRREPVEKSGVSNLTAEMMLKGTKRRDGTKILWELESLGAELSSGPEPDLVRFYLSSSGKNFPRALEIMADVVRNPQFPEGAFQIEKNKLMMRLRSIGDDMFENTWRLFLANMYAGHPYGRYHLGEAGDVEKLTVADLKQYHAHAYVPNNVVMAVVGDVTASEAIKLIYTTFGALPPGPAWSDEKAPAEPAGVKAFKEVRDARDKKQAFVCLGWLGPKIGHPDYIKVKVLNAILGGGMSARYFMNIRNKSSLAYAVSSMFPSRMFGGALLAAIGTDPNMVDRVRDAVMDEAEDIMKNGVQAEELARAIAYETGKFALDHDSCQKNSSYLAWFESIGAGFQYDDAYLKDAKVVTAEDIKEMANKYLGKNRALMTVTGPEAGSGEQKK